MYKLSQRYRSGPVTRIPLTVSLSSLASGLQVTPHSHSASHFIPHHSTPLQCKSIYLRDSSRCTLQAACNTIMQGTNESLIHLGRKNWQN